MTIWCWWWKAGYIDEDEDDPKYQGGYIAFFIDGDGDDDDDDGDGDVNKLIILIVMRMTLTKESTSLFFIIKCSSSAVKYEIKLYSKFY